MPLYIADYLADTTHLGALQSGAYLHLIMHYWQHGGLPDNDGSLMRIAKVTASEWRRERPVLAAFFQGGWKHKRIDTELAHALEVSSKRRAIALQRHGKKDAIAPPIAEQEHTQLHTTIASSSRPEPYDPSAQFQKDSSERRDQAAPSAANLPTDPSAIYSEAELRGFVFEFDGMDVIEAIRELAHWANRKGITDPIERKSVIYGGLKTRYAKARAAADLAAPSTAQASPELLATLMRKGRAKPPEPELPEFLDRRKRA